MTSPSADVVTLTLAPVTCATTSRPNIGVAQRPGQASVHNIATRCTPCADQAGPIRRSGSPGDVAGEMRSARAEPSIWYSQLAWRKRTLLIRINRSVATADQGQGTILPAELPAELPADATY